ncbi:unnamed protein product [Ambrosiozyma monospora]|uniref:Unnamed protein product n=1 Tax=Ambrosiozyma monospora TaxID=43982 RepID=A0A9W6Z452_AMBMO|nr:unnamed protein product [Ambrosiozyma monospora]
MYNDSVSSLAIGQDMRLMGQSKMSMSPTNMAMSLPVLPSLGTIDDPLHFLKNQEILLLNSLQKLIKNHHTYLAKGDKRLLKNRRRILDSFYQLYQIHQSMKELYNSDKYSKLNLLKEFQARANRKAKIQKRIHDIQSNTDEGKTYQLLYNESVSVESEIVKLEARLKDLKNRQRVVNRQLMENKSMLDVRLNGYRGSLQEIEAKEKVELNYLLNDRLLSVPATADSKEVISNLKLQVSALNDLTKSAKSNEDSFNQSFHYLSDMFENLIKLESDIKQFVKENRADLIQSNLTKSKGLLAERIEQLTDPTLSPVRKILSDEFSTISKALRIISGVSPSESEDENDGNSITSTVFVSDVEPAQVRSNDGSRHTSQEMRKSPSGFLLTPPSYALPSTTTTNVTSSTQAVSATASSSSPSGEPNRGAIGTFLKRGSRDRRYSLTAKIMQDSKGEKKD